jgi:lysophospholipid acyltransferase 1/2
MPGVYTFYDGSRLFSPLVPYFGLDSDKLNLLCCQLLSIPIAWAFRRYLKPHGANGNTLRLLIPLLIGVAFCYFCFGRAIKHIIGMIGFSYILLLFSPVQYVGLLVFIYAMGYLIFMHWYRWIYLGSYQLDITGPMMVMVQKVTLLAFSLHDGHSKKELTDTQRKEALKEVPSLLAYLSYLFKFQTILVGPLSLYTDYMNFINGTGEHYGKSNLIPNPYWTVLKKLLSAFCFGVLIYNYADISEPEQIISPSALAMPFYKWLIFFWFVIFMQRAQYYYVWIFSDAICNLSGFGFNGFTDNGDPKWEMMTNVNAWEVETATSFKETLDGWNITTMQWLRRIAYERVPKYRTACTYLLSAIWHGFFLGYYLTFITGALVTLAARTVRRCLRHHFKTNLWRSHLYDFLTFIATKFALMYTTFPFVVMNLTPGLILYRRLYFCIHILSICSIIILPKLLPPLKNERNDNKKIK